MCFTPQRRAIFWHQTSEKWSVPLSFSTFWLTNMLRATAACHFWTSQLPKWLRRWGVFYIFTYKYASRHSCVAFWNIATSKMAPALRCFLHFDLQICFAPQPRGILEHWNFQNGSGAEVFSTIWLTNVLFATAAWHFGTLELPKCLRRWGVFYNLTRKCAFRHSRVPFFTCPRNSYLRTRRFSEATFRTSGTTTHWKNTAIRDVTNICRACWTPCYWLYTHVDLDATDSTRMLIFLLLTWLLCDSAFQLYILSEVRLLNFLRLRNYILITILNQRIPWTLWNVRKVPHDATLAQPLSSWLALALAKGKSLSQRSGKPNTDWSHMPYVAAVGHRLGVDAK